MIDNYWIRFPNGLEVRANAIVAFYQLLSQVGSPVSCNVWVTGCREDPFEVDCTAYQLSVALNLPEPENYRGQRIYTDVSLYPAEEPKDGGGNATDQR